MLNVTSLVLSLFGILIILITSYLIGVLLQKGVNAIQKNTTELHLYWKLFSGFFLLLSIYAIINTKGVSILLPVPLLVFLFNCTMVSSQSLNQTKRIQANRKKNMFFLVLCTLFHFIFYAITFYSFSPDVIKYVSFDFNVYLRVAEYLNKVGIENNSLDWLSAGQHHATPYHYGDLWLYAIASKIFQKNQSAVLLISLTTLSTLAVYGIKTYIHEKFNSYLNTRNFYNYLLIFCGLFSGFAILFPQFLLHANVYAFSILNFPKLLLPTVIFISLLILVGTKDWTALVIITMIGGLSFINILPQVYGAVILFLMLNAVKRNIKVNKALGLSALLIFATVGFCWILYNNHNKVVTTTEGYVTFNVAAYIKRCINIFVSGNIQLFTIMPYLVIFIIGLFVVYGKNAWQQIRLVNPDIVFIGLLYVCGLSCWAILHPLNSDAVQFFVNGLVTIYSITIPLLLIWIVAVVRNKTITVITCLLIFMSVFLGRKDNVLIGSFDRNEWTKMTSFFRTDTIIPGFANIYPNAYFSTFYHKNTSYYLPLDILTYKWPAYNNLSLNAPYIHSDPTASYYKTEQKMIEEVPFTKYVRKYASDKSNKEYLVTTFLKKFRIRYITVSKDTVLPIYLRPAIKDSLYLKSAGFTIYRLSSL